MYRAASLFAFLAVVGSLPLRPALAQQPDDSFMIGLRCAVPSDKQREAYDLPADTGLVIVDVMKNSPAEKAGLEVGQTLLRVGGNDIKSLDTLTQAVQTAGRNQSSFRVSVMDRNRKLLTREIRPMRRTEVSPLDLLGSEAEGLEGVGDALQRLQQLESLKIGDVEIDLGELLGGERSGNGTDNRDPLEIQGRINLGKLLEQWLGASNAEQEQRIQRLEAEVEQLKAELEQLKRRPAKRATDQPAEPKRRKARELK